MNYAPLAGIRTWRGKSPPTVPALRKPKAWIKGIAMIAAAPLGPAPLGLTTGLFAVGNTDPGDETDPESRGGHNNK
jgi:hypothetical protein